MTDASALRSKHGKTMRYTCSTTMKDLPKPLTDSRSFIISHSIFAGYMLVARMYANRSAKVMEATVHNGIERCLINCSHTEQIVEEMVQRYIAGTGPKRKLGAWHRFKIRNNRPAKKSIDYLFKIKIGRACVGKECRSRWSPYK